MSVLSWIKPDWRNDAGGTVPDASAGADLSVRQGIRRAVDRHVDADIRAGDVADGHAAADADGHADADADADADRRADADADRRADADADRRADADADGRADRADRPGLDVVVLNGDHAHAHAELDVDGAPILRRHWAESPRCATEPLGSLNELLRFAREAHYNFSHIEAVRAAHIVFFWMVTAPVLTVAWPLLWAYIIRFHRALTCWGLTFLVAPPANGWIDWLVPDALVWTAWSASTWQVVCGLTLVFVLATGALVRWG